jgi:hypothetical protein
LSIVPPGDSLFKSAAASVAGLGAAEGSYVRMMRLLALSLALLVFASPLAACSGTRGISSHGVRVTVPPGWQRLEPAGDGNVVDPRTVLVVGTAGVKARSSECQIAAYRVQPAGAVVVVVRWKTLTSGGGGVEQGRAPLRKLRRVRRPSFEFFAGRGAAVELGLRGHAYQVNVLVGDRTSARRVAEALRVARSLDLVRSR